MLPATDVQLGFFQQVMPIIGVAALASCALGQFGPVPGDPALETPHATMRLAVEHDVLTPGEQELAVVFTIDPDWHLYWENPGETGLAPAFELTLPDGIELAGETRWPAPERYVHGAGQILDYIYADDVALLVPVRVRDSLVGSTVEIGVSGSWLVCKEACIPGDGEATLRVSVAGDAGALSGDAAVIGASRERVPTDDATALGVRTAWDGVTLSIDAPGADELEFFPLEPRLGGPSDAISDAAALGDRLRVRFDERVVRAERVVGVVGVTRSGRERFVTVTLPAPRPVE